jgi:hypothetical protein
VNSVQQNIKCGIKGDIYFVDKVETQLMLRLFRRKMISGKWFRYFLVFGRGENNGQPENDFRLTKNA